MLHQVTRAIVPDFSLRAALRHWQEIQRDLAESPRQRVLQLQKWSKTS
jgi:hypothetical protein